MIVVTYLLRQSITLYKNLGGGLEPLSPIASAATVTRCGHYAGKVKDIIIARLATVS